MGGTWSSVHKTSDKAFSLMDSILRNTLPIVNTVLNNANELIDFTKLGVVIAGLKLFSDMGVSWCRSIKLIGVSSGAGNDLKKIADHTIKTENEIVNVLKNTSSDLKSSFDLLTEDVHKMGQDFGHMTESLSQSSAEVSGAVNQASRNFGYVTHVTADFLAYLSQDMYQNSRCFRVTCFSLTMSALATAMTYLQNSSCDRDPESTLCTAPLKSMAATTITAGFVAMTLLMPNRVSNETINECLDLDFFIPEEGIDQNIECTKEQLDSIKSTNFAVFKYIEMKRQFGGKWHKQELKWLLSQDKNLFLKVILNRACAISDCLNDNN